jgi:uncharacterized protein YggL (DUF469 family)
MKARKSVPMIPNIKSILFMSCVIAANIYVYDGLGFRSAHCPTLMNELGKQNLTATLNPKLA